MNATNPSGRDAPLPASALELLVLSEAELVAATLSSGAAERFLHAHLSAMRAGAALLQATGRPPRRRTVRTVWDMVAVMAPDLGRWAGFFAANAPLRSAIEAGRTHVVDHSRAEHALRAAEDFHVAVRDCLGLAPGDASQLRFAS